MKSCEKCPRCKAERHRYVKRIRGQWMTIAVSCEVCGYTGKEIPMSHNEDSDAAMKAAVAWDIRALEMTSTRTLH